MPRQRLPQILDTAADTMNVLGVHPLRFEASMAGASMIVVMPSTVLHQRSKGPYHPDRPPPEAIRLIELIALRCGGPFSRTQLDVDVNLDARWARVRLDMGLPEGTVRITFVAPEDAPTGWQPPEGDVTVPIGIKIALESIAASVRALGFDVPMSVLLRYPPGSPPGLRHMPVVPTLDLDRQGMSSSLRKQHERILQSEPGIHSGKGRLAAAFSRRFEVWAGAAVRIRDST
jgi:hypothetical protein